MFQVQKIGLLRIRYFVSQAKDTAALQIEKNMRADIFIMEEGYIVQNLRKFSHLRIMKSNSNEISHTSFNALALKAISGVHRMIKNIIICFAS